jgi:hypothetical protein
VIADAAENRDKGRYLVERARGARREARLGACIDFADRAVAAVQGDHSRAGIEIFVDAIDAKIRALRSSDQRRSCLLLAEHTVKIARSLLPRSRARGNAEALLLAAREMSYESQGSLAGLSRLYDDCMKLADELPNNSDARIVAVDLRLTAGRIARRGLCDAYRSRYALDQAETLIVFHDLSDPELTCRFYLAAGLVGLIWGPVDEAHDYLKVAEILAQHLPELRVYLRFGAAAQVLRYSDQTEGASLFFDACDRAEEIGYWRPARVGRIDLAPYL